ncbi:MAG: hypothetical protein LBH24_05955 [Clostridiales bacterium]|jgi:hypothetical protein|nr:hypothetical protein [Clostridiales bacterium]
MKASKILARKKEAEEKLKREIQGRLRMANLICAAGLLVVLLLYFCDFFRVNIDGNIQNNTSGFRLAFLLLGDEMSGVGNIFTVLKKDYLGTIAFASVTTLLTLLLLLAALAISVYHVVQKKALLSKSAVILQSALFLLLIVQLIACGSLTSVITGDYYSGCATCLAQTLSFVTLPVFLVYLTAYAGSAYWLYRQYGIGWKESRALNASAKP